MSDRGLLFIFSVVMIVICLGATAALFISGQIYSVDGLFLMLMCLSVALAFALYLMFMIRRALEALQPPPPAKPAAKPAAAKTAPVPAAQAE